MMINLIGDSNKYYYEVQELITFISINISKITFTSEELIEATNSSGMKQLEKRIFKKWLKLNVPDENITLQVRGFSENNDTIYKIFDMNSTNWNEIIPLGIEPIFRACQIDYVLDLSGIKNIEQVNFEEARKYIDLDFFKLKCGLAEIDIFDNTSEELGIDGKYIEMPKSTDIDELNDEDKYISNKKPIDYSDIEEKYKDNSELLENLKKLREMDIL